MKEANENPVFRSMVGNLTLLLTQNITNTANVTNIINTNMPIQQQLNPQYISNQYIYISIDNKLKPKLLEKYESHLVITPGKKCSLTDLFCPIWAKSHYDVKQPIVDI